MRRPCVGLYETLQSLGLISRLRATSATAAAPNNRTTGGAGTGVPLDPELPVLPWLLEPWPLEPCQPLDPPKLLDELELDDELELLELELDPPVLVEVLLPPVLVLDPPVEVLVLDPPLPPLEVLLLPELPLDVLELPEEPLLPEEPELPLDP